MASRKEYEMLFQLNAQLGGGFNGTFSKAQKEVTNLQREIQNLSKIQSDISAYQKQQSAIENTKAKLANLQKQYDNIQKEIDETGKYSSDLVNKQLSLQLQKDKTSASLQQQTDKLNQMGSALRDAGVNTDNLSSETSRLSDKMNELKDTQEDIINGTEEYGASAPEAFGAVQNAIAAAGVATALKEIADMYSECIDASMEFEGAMTGVSKTTDMSDGELAAMSEEIKTLSTEIPITSTELASVAEVAGQLGIAKDDLLDFSTIMSMLSTATTMSADEAATMLAQFANITQMDPKYYSNLASTIVDLGNNYATTEQKITDMAQGIAASASLAGMSEADMVALSAAVTSLGIETQAGATSMSKLISELGSAVETGDNLGQIASIANMTSAEFQEAWGQNAVTALEAFVVGLNDAERNGMSATQALSELGITETRMQRMILSMANSGDLLSRTLDTANNAWKENTALTVEAEKRYATTQSKLTMMQNSYNNLKVSIGDALIPEMRGLYDVGTDVMSGASEFISSNPTLVKSVTAFVGVLGAATAGMTAYAAISKTVKALELGSLFTTGGPIMLAIAGAATLATAVVGITDAYNEAQIAARRYGDEVIAAADEYREAMNTSNELENHISEWRSLNKTISSGAASADEVTAAKERLQDTEQWLIDNYGIYLDNDGTISEEEIKSLEARNDELRETARLKAEIAFHDAKKAFDEAEKEGIPQIKEKRDNLQEQNRELAEQQRILQKVSAEWEKYTRTDEYQDYAKHGPGSESGVAVQAKMDEFNERLQSTVQYGATGDVRSVEADLASIGSTIDRNSDKVSEYNQELLEYNESLTALQKAGREFADYNLSTIPTDNLKDFAEIAQSIGEQVVNAQLDASEFESYAEKLTEVAHAAGLLTEEQKIVFNADGALNVIEELEDGVSELDGQTAEIIADANADAAYIKINDAKYKVLQYDQTTGIATLSADGTNATAQIDIATGEVRMFDEEEAEAYLYANTDNFTSNIQSAKNLLATIQDKTVTIKSVFKSVYENVQSKLKIGVGEANGTNYAPPGAHWVGENGPELLWFNGGEKVLNARDSAALVRDYSKMAEAQKILNASDYNMALSAIRNYSEISEVQTDLFIPLIATSMSAINSPRPFSAIPSSETPEYKIEIKNEFTIEGNATEETIATLENWGERFREIVRDEVAEISENNRRSVYI